MKQFYSSAAYIPPLILLQHHPDDFFTLERWLSDRGGREVRLRVPLRGAKRKLVDMVAENARQSLEYMLLGRMTAARATSAALEEIKKALKLPRLPKRIECYDISDISGKSAVGAMVGFEEGEPRKEHYRRFRIKTVGGTDDYAMMQEVLMRRFKKVGEFEDTWAITPDLVLIDGGRGHLNAAVDVIKSAGSENIAVASIAKENEEIFRPGMAEPIVLPRDSAALRMLQFIRDEAHRFAIGYHRKVRGRESVKSALDNVPGIGPKRKKALLRKFGSVKAIKEASTEDIAAVPGMTRVLAAKIKEYL